MRVKTRIIIVLLLVVLIVCTGCNNKPIDLSQPTDKPDRISPRATAKPPQGITVNKIDFIKVSLSDLGSEKLETINNLTALRGYYFWRDDNGGFKVFIGMGEKSTGGYNINVLSVEDNEGKTNILVEEIIPKADDNVSQALTYPYVVIEMKGITDQFNITNTNNEKFKLINQEELMAETISGIYQGQIDGNSIEIKVDGSYMVFRNPEMSTMIAGLKKDDSVVIIYKEITDGQNIIESINPVNVENKIIVGVYQGQIDNNSIEVKVDDSFMVFRNTEMSKLVNTYKKDDIVLITYSILENGQFTLMKIEPGK